MKVILNSDVEKLGRKGDIVEVAAGYARNFLLPRKLAMAATKGALNQAETMRRSREEKDQKERAVFESLASKIAGAELKLAARVGEEGHLFGSITAADIAQALEQAVGEEVDRRKVQIPEPIRSVGTHEFKVSLHRDVTAVGSLQVVEEE